MTFGPIGPSRARPCSFHASTHRLRVDLRKHLTLTRTTWRRASAHVSTSTSSRSTGDDSSRGGRRPVGGRGSHPPARDVHQRSRQADHDTAHKPGEEIDSDPARRVKAPGVVPLVPVDSTRTAATFDTGRRCRGHGQGLERHQPTGDRLGSRLAPVPESPSSTRRTTSCRRVRSCRGVGRPPRLVFAGPHVTSCLALMTLPSDRSGAGARGSRCERRSDSRAAYTAASARRLMPELRQQVRHVVLHRLLRQEHLLADLTVGQPLGDAGRGSAAPVR